MAWSHGSFYWNELLTKDAERAKRFYADTIGWTYQAKPMLDGDLLGSAHGRQARGGNLPDQSAGVPRSAGSLDVLSRGR
jgi:predicted enzyme related to lactoylglutathione lyase